MSALAGPITHGVDVAVPQGLVAWTKVVRWRGPNGEKIEFALCRATVGNLGLDEYFLPNWAGIAAVGLVRAGYHAADPDEINLDDAGDEARRFCARLLAAGFRRGIDFAMLDIERAGKIHAGPVFAQWVRDFCRVCVERLEMKPLIYTGKYFWESETAGCAAQDVLDELASYPLVLAAYVNESAVQRFVPSIWHDWTLWQKSGDVAASDSTVLHVDGIATKVDHDVFRGTVEDLRAFIASLVVSPATPSTLPAPPPSPDPFDEAAHALQLARLHELEEGDELPDTQPGTPTSKSSQRLAAVTAPIAGVDDGPPTPRGSSES